MIISPASFSDLPEILALQRLAFQTEAEILQDWTIQPLTETLEEVQQEFEAGPVLKACDEKTGQIVGSIRGRVKDGTLFFAKLVVHPDFRRQGIGPFERAGKNCPSSACRAFHPGRQFGERAPLRKRGVPQSPDGKRNRKTFLCVF